MEEKVEKDVEDGALEVVAEGDRVETGVPDRVPVTLALVVVVDDAVTVADGV